MATNAIYQISKLLLFVLGIILLYVLIIYFLTPKIYLKYKSTINQLFKGSIIALPVVLVVYIVSMTARQFDREKAIFNNFVPTYSFEDDDSGDPINMDGGFFKRIWGGKKLKRRSK